MRKSRMRMVTIASAVTRRPRSPSSSEIVRGSDAPEVDGVRAPQADRRLSQIEGDRRDFRLAPAGALERARTVAL
jgi:hypothetical protein